jgi:hypothetical protein
MKTTIDHDQAAMRRSAELLDAIGRDSETSAVALHCLTAAHLLSGAGIDHDTSGGRPASDRVALDEVLALFASVSPKLLRDEDLVEALHHVLLAHIAAP